jgi:hypothetical protein
MAFKKLGLVVGVLMMFQVSNAALSIIEMNKMSAALESMQPHRKHAHNHACLNYRITFV